MTRDSHSFSFDTWIGLALVVLAHGFAWQWLASARPVPRPLTPPRPIEVTLLQPAPPQPPQPVIEPPKPKPVAPVPPKPRAQKVVPRPRIPPPQLVAEPIPNQPTVAEALAPPPEPVRIEAPPAPPEPAAPVVAAPAAPPPPPAPPAPEPVTPPLFNADYLANPAPPYPSLSRRMGEQGKVVLRVFVDPQGLPQRIELRNTSGFDRLDEVAMATVKHWKFVPARQGEKTIAAWVLIPINFNLREGK